MEGNYEERLIRRKAYRRVDRRKVTKLFRGWGDGDIRKYDDVIDEMTKTVARKRCEYWRRRKEELKDDVSKSYEVVKRSLGGRSEPLKQLDQLRNDMLQHEWERNNKKMNDRLSWLKNEGRRRDMYVNKRRKKPSDGNVKTDEFLIEKFGPVEVDNPVIYGDVNVNVDESEALCLPPKYAMYEKLDLKDFGKEEM